jgi:murein DD-endopeptidase
MRSSVSSSRPGRRPLRALLAAVLAVAAVGTGVVVTAAPASAATVAWRRVAPAGTTLAPGDSVTSANGQFRLVMQGDGNLVEYGIGDAVLWASNTAGKPGAVGQIRKDGTLAIWYGKSRAALWGTSGPVSKDFGIRPDGSMRMTDTANRVVLSFPTFQASVPAGNVILPGTVLRSDASTARTLTMRADGVLTQRIDNRQVWASPTGGNKNAYAAVQKDGNFVVYAPGRKPLWATGTNRLGPAKLLVQVDGNVVVYGGKDQRVWSTRPVSGMLWPVTSSRISGGYGDDRGPGHVPRYHQGTDAAVGIGTPVYGSGTGTVTSTVANNATYGNYVVVTYGMTTVLTAHLSVIEVKTGQIVSATTEIAKSGNTGQSTGPHVHVETRVNGTLADPLTILHFR